MNTKEEIKRLKHEIAVRNEYLRWIRSHREKLEICPHGRFFDSNQSLDFDCLPHSEVMKVISILGGKWTKKLAGTKIDYSADIDGFLVRCWSGEPPPSCKIVEETVEIPAQPATTEKRLRLVCDEGSL